MELERLKAEYRKVYLAHHDGGFIRLKIIRDAEPPDGVYHESRRIWSHVTIDGMPIGTILVWKEEFAATEYFVPSINEYPRSMRKAVWALLKSKIADFCPLVVG